MGNLEDPAYFIPARGEIMRTLLRESSLAIDKIEKVQK
jgi:hypothetical protein